MKKWLFFLLLSHAIGTAYLGNPTLTETTDKGFFLSKENGLEIKTGYQREWVFNRNMQTISKTSKQTMNHFTLISDQGVLSCTFINHLEIYGSAGTSHISTAHYSTQNVYNEYASHNQFIWGMGARYLFTTWKDVSLGISLFYEYTHPMIQWIKINALPTSFKTKANIIYYEWQIGLGASYRIHLFSPYVMIKYSNAMAHFRHLPKDLYPHTHRFKAINRRHFGLACGLSCSTSSPFSINIETHIIDEYSITLTTNMKF